MALGDSTTDKTGSQSNIFSEKSENESLQKPRPEPDPKLDEICQEDDVLCWRCGLPDSEHIWVSGETYCEPEAEEDACGLDLTRTFQVDPPAMSDEELVRRMEFLRDTRDWML